MMEITAQEMQKQDRECNQYEQVVDEYRDDLMHKWRHTPEGREALAEFVAEHAMEIADILACNEWQWRAVEITQAMDRIIYAKVESMIQDVSIAVVQDICETYPVLTPLHVLEEAESNLSNVS